MKQAIENGNQLVVNTDAHAAVHMDFIKFGVFVARRGWAQKSDIINTQPLSKIKKWIHS